jgi:hypothetical protein
MLEEIQHSLIYPFRDKRWFYKLWPLLILPLIPVIGIISLIFYNGWRLEMIKNIADGNLDLPILNLRKIFVNGFILWLTFSLYIFVPSIVCAIFGISGPLAYINDVYEIYQNGFYNWSETGLADLLLAGSIYLLWTLISVPMFHVGMVRFALSENLKNLFNIPINLLFLVRYSFSFLKFYLYAFILILLITAIDVALSLTGIGLLFVTLITISGYYISTAYELGQLARKILKQPPLKLDVIASAITN